MYTLDLMQDVAVYLFKYWSKMMSKCGNRKKNNVAHEVITKCITKCCYHILTSSMINYWTDAQQHGIYMFYAGSRKQSNVNDVICSSVLQLIISMNQSKARIILSLLVRVPKRHKGFLSFQDISLKDQTPERNCYQSISLCLKVNFVGLLLKCNF